MSTSTDHGVVFLTTPADLGIAILADLRVRFPNVRWTVYYRVTQRDALGDALADLDARSDKPGGSKIAFIKDIRQQRYKIAVIAWTRHHDYDRMKVVGLLSGAERHVIYNENLESFDLSPRDPTWVHHAQWRLSMGRGVTPAFASLLFVVYKWTAGLAIGALLRASQLFLWRVRRRWNTGPERAMRPGTHAPGRA